MNINVAMNINMAMDIMKTNTAMDMARVKEATMEMEEATVMDMDTITTNN